MPNETSVKSLKSSLSPVWEGISRHWFSHLIFEYRKPIPQGALIDETSSAVFSLEFLDRKQSVGTTHKYYDRRGVTLSLLMGLGWWRSFTTCSSSALKGIPSELILCPTTVEARSDEAQSSKECSSPSAFGILLPTLSQNSFLWCTF